jgi:hypothetical protein
VHSRSLNGFFVYVHFDERLAETEIVCLRGLRLVQFEIRTKQC